MTIDIHLSSIFLSRSFSPFLPPTDGALPRLGDVGAAEAFIDSAEVVVVGFFEVSRGNERGERGDGGNREDARNVCSRPT